MREKMASKKKINKNDELIVLDQESAGFMKERTEAHRLQFMPATIALLIGLILLVLTSLRYFYPAFELFSEQSSWRTIALRQVIHFGMIPLLVISLVLLIYKPSSFLISQRKEAPLSIVSALLLGITTAFAYFLVIELLNRINWLDQVSNFLPGSLTIFTPFLRESAARTLTVLIFSVFLPTISLIPLLLGLFLSPLLGSEKRFLPLSFTCLLGALLPLDSSAFFAYLLVWIIISRIYAAGSGLITAALSCISYLATLMYAPRIFALLSNRFIAWQSTSDLQGTLLVFTLLLIVLILGLPGIFHFNILDRDHRRKQLSLSLQPHISKHIEKTKVRSAFSWVLIVIALVLLLAALLLNYFV